MFGSSTGTSPILSKDVNLGWSAAGSRGWSQIMYEVRSAGQNLVLESQSPNLALSGRYQCKF